MHAFERYGFYWLGHDVLMDTMHYEFLGDPDKIRRTGGAGNASSSPTPASTAPAVGTGAGPGAGPDGGT